MAQTIKLKRSSVAGNIPSTSDLALGEVAINTADGKMYIKKSVDGTDSIIDLSDSPQDAILQEYQFTASANQTTFSGADDNNDTLYYTAGAVQIFLNGILLDSGIDYTATSNTSIVLAETVDANDYLQVFAFKQKISGGSVTVNTFTGNGSTTAFTLSVNPGDENNTRVFIDGVYQSKSNYSVSATTLTFTTAPPTGTAIEVESGNRDVALDTATNLDFPDNVKLRLGTSQDLQIYHSGTHSFITDGGTGDLKILGANIEIGNTGAVLNFKGISAGASNVYHNGNLKLATTSGGVAVTGSVTANSGGGGAVLGSHLDLGDNQKARFGASDDLQIFHDGFNSYITDSGTGNLRISGTLIQLNDASFNKYLLGSGDSVTLYNADSPKLQTTSTGINVTGTGTFSGNVDVNSDGGQLQFGADNDMQIYHNGANGEINVPATDFTIDAGGDIFLDADGGQVYFQDGGVLHGSIDMTSGLIFRNHVSNADVHIQGNDGGSNINALTLDMSQAGRATFNEGIVLKSSKAGDFGVNINTLAGDSMQLQVVDTGSAGAAHGSIEVSDGHLTLDAAGEIHLDADDGIIRVRDDGGDYGMFQISNSDFIIRSMVSDKDLVFKGNDNGSVFTALTLDMSDAGVAFFNSDIRLVDNAVIRLGDGQDFRLWHDGNHNTIQSTLVDSDIYIKGNDGGSTITMLGFDTSAGGNATFSGSVTSTTGFTTGANTRVQASSGMLFLNGPSAVTFEVGAGSEKMRLTSTGLGIGTTSPSYKLHVKETGTNAGAIYVEDGTSWLRVVPNLGGGGFNPMSAAGDIGLIFSNDNDSSTNSSTNGLLIASHSTSASGIKILEDGRVGIGEFSPDYTLHVKSGSTNVVAKFESTDSTSVIQFVDPNGNCEFGTTGSIGRISPNGSYAVLEASQSAVVINNAAQDCDFRVEGTSQPNMLVVDAAENKVGINRSPNISNSKLEVGGADDVPLINVEASGVTGGMGIGSTGLQFFHGSTSRMRITSTGNVGIGTTGSPSRRFEIHENTTNLTIGEKTGYTPSVYGPVLETSANAITLPRDLYLAGSQASLRNVSNVLTLSGDNGTVFRYYDGSAGQEGMRLTNAGNVGIGTSAPAEILHVAGGNLSTIRNNMLRIISNTDGAGGETNIMHNAYYSSGYNYGVSDEAARINFIDGKISLETAAAGSEGSAITWINGLKVLADGTVDVANDLLTNNAKLKAIAESNTDTAIDVFVYDTRKDSDGGAWRKRTQNTSWYNETLNTSIRGARKEFPCVAVIVAETGGITIYDGDDPDLPMWMVISGSGIRYGTVTAGLEMLNGILFFTGNVSCSEINFITDFMGLHQASSISQTKPSWSLGIIERYSSAGSWKTEGAGTGSVIKTGTLVNQATNDVAMTVLPNAPIDADTGLPVPTIALATDGGVSVIKDDGTVVDITNSSDTGYQVVGVVDFINTSEIIFGMDAGAGARAIRVHDIPLADVSVGAYWYLKGTSKRFYKGYVISTAPDLYILGENSTVKKFMLDGVISSNLGLTLLDENITTPTEGSAAYIASDYNTGWMVGDTKLATLSDTDTTNAVGTELVTNGDFTGTGNVTGWTVQGSATNNNGSNVLNITTGSSTNIVATQALTLVVGKSYVVSFERVTGTSTCSISVSGAGLGVLYSSTAGVETRTFVATSTSGTLLLNTGSGSQTIIVDNVSVRLAEEDRSVNGNGVQVFGTVTKAAVATGADLVAYSGFSTSNYLKQPYNSDLQFGTGNFSVMGWYKVATASTTYRTLVYYNSVGVNGVSTGDEGFQIIINPDEKIYFYIYGPTTDANMQHTKTTDDGAWHFFCATSENNNSHKLYIDGALVATTSATVGSLNNTSAQLMLGTYGGVTAGSTFPFTDGSLANIRLSATAPSEEQIKKMYNDEKHLFSTNAKATLYGSSDAVTAIAYDDDTELLHAGTSAGRSEFQGLRRVNNTTDAVGSAISASNGFIVED